MRIALLSALADPQGAGGASAGERAAFRRFAGKTVLSHQIDCAAHLGCERVVCLASGLGPDLSAARSYCERAGLRFDLVELHLRLIDLITADDEIVVICDGVLPDRAVLVETLAKHPGVVAFPADPAIALGFERIDARLAWSGVLRASGASVARLADLPTDCDLASSLLRIALQMGERVVEIGPAPVADGMWQRRVSHRTAAGTEWRWVTHQVRPAPFTAPAMALIERVGLRLARDAGGGRWARAPHAAAFLGGALALLAALVGWPVAGLICLLGASVALAVAGLFARVEALGARPRAPGHAMTVAAGLRDLLLVALLARLVVTVPSWLGLALPVMLVAVLRLGEASSPPRLRALFGDRVLLIAGFVPVAYSGWATAAVTALTIAGLAGLLLAAATRPPARLTAD